MEANKETRKGRKIEREQKGSRREREKQRKYEREEQGKNVKKN